MILSSIRAYFKKVFLNCNQVSKLSFLLIFFIFATFFSAVIPGKGEEINLEQPLELFYKNKYDILINRYEIDKAYADYVGAKLRPNPTFSLIGTGLKVHGLPRLSDDNGQKIGLLDCIYWLYLILVRPEAATPHICWF